MTNPHALSNTLYVRIVGLGPKKSRIRHWAAFVVALACGCGDALAQGPASRTEEIERERREKQATLWPEREDPLVARANGLLNRGFQEGLQPEPAPTDGRCCWPAHAPVTVRRLASATAARICFTTR